MSDIFIKHNPLPGSDSLLREADGLQLLKQGVERSGAQLSIPEVYQISQHELQLEKISLTQPTPQQMRLLGQELARLHSVAQPFYGLKQDNYLGLSKQINGECDHWGEFFLQQRLGYQVAKIRQRGLKERFSNQLKQHGDKLSQFLNDNCKYPSLVHGDLWSGNVLFDQNKVWLIDPAVYYGDREVDLAMTEMFSGFSVEFYQGYDEILPRTQHYPVKKVMYNLYHYLNHYNLFGDSYLDGCEQGFTCLERL